MSFELTPGVLERSRSEEGNVDLYASYSVNEHNCLDPTRIKVRESLSKALWDRSRSDVSLQIHTAVEINQLAMDVENSILSCTFLVCPRYKTKYRQLYFNLSNSLYRKIIERSLPFDELVMLPTWELANEATKDWRKHLIKHQLDSVRMNEVRMMNSRELRFVKTVEGDDVVPKTEFETFEDPHSEPIRNKTVVLADVYDLIPDFTDHHPSHEHTQFITGCSICREEEESRKIPSKRISRSNKAGLSTKCVEGPSNRQVVLESPLTPRSDYSRLINLQIYALRTELQRRPQDGQLLNWMLWRERESTSGGFLVDLGDGKRSLLTSLISHNRSLSTLIICAENSLGEWIETMRRSGLTVAKYFGVNRRFLISTLHEFEVVATTFKRIVIDGLEDPVFLQKVLKLRAARRWVIAGDLIDSPVKLYTRTYEPYALRLLTKKSLVLGYLD